MQDGTPTSSAAPTERERVQPELVDGGNTASVAAELSAATAGEAAGDDASEQISSPTKLIRIASMVRTMLDEVRRAPLDDAGRRRLREIHEKSLEELERRAVARPPPGALRGRPARSPATRRRSRSCASRRPSSSAGSKACSTASRPRCSPSRPRPRVSSSRCADAPSTRAPARRPVRAGTCERDRRRPHARRPDRDGPSRRAPPHEAVDAGQLGIARRRATARLARSRRARRRAPHAAKRSRRSCSPVKPAASPRRSPRSPNRRGFVLQAGDCAESFDAFSANAIRDKLKVILQMAVVLTYGSGVPTVKIGRIAGQFAKPRSAPTERRGDVELPSFRGDMVNDFAFEAAARRPDPDRLVRAYHQAASTLNLLRAFAKGGFADLAQVHAWNLEYVDASPEGRRYDTLAGEIDARAALHGRVRHRPRERAPAAPGRLLHVARGAHPRLRGSADTGATASPTTGTTARPICCGSESAPVSSAARTSSSSAASRTRSA